MGIVNQQICDCCGRVLYGKKGTTFVKEDYIQIKGQITKHSVDKTTQWISHMHLTPTDSEDLSFCNMECLEGYMASRETYVRMKIENKKRQQATDEASDDAMYGYSAGPDGRGRFTRNTGRRGGGYK